MRYNRLLVGKALAVVLACGTAGTAYASDGTITFNGTITSTTCGISVNNSGSGSGTITLPTVASSVLGATDTVAGRTPFTIALVGCATDAGVEAYFEQGANTDLTNNVLTNAASGTPASNVTVQLLNADQDVIQLNQAAGSQDGTTATTDATTGNATLNYFAEYKATGVATAGNVSTSTQYSIVYD